MTVILRLFEKDAPGVEVDSRVLAEGEITVGRDQTADWVIADPSRTLSRRHCLIAVKDGAATIRDDSVNGVFLQDGARLPAKTPTLVAPGGTVVLGAFLIRIETRHAQPASVPATTIRPVAEETPAGPLLDAFCSGAQIDSSVLSAEDPAEVMRRLGAIYREMVQGLGKLVNERTRVKAECGLEWTAVQALDNNPFRWAPPQRVAVDLLQTKQEGFLGADAAVRSSFADVFDHQLRLAAGSQAAIEALMADLAPDAIAEGLQGQSMFMKNKAEALWAEYRRVHDKARKDVDGGGAAFREAYANETFDVSGTD